MGIFDGTLTLCRFVQVLLILIHQIFNENLPYDNYYTKWVEVKGK